jgi:hypothetical protein
MLGLDGPNRGSSAFVPLRVDDRFLERYVRKGEISAGPLCSP